jgi:hypothetical protein
MCKHVTYIKDTRNVYRILIGKPEGKREFLRFLNRQEDIAKINAEKCGIWL